MQLVGYVGELQLVDELVELNEAYRIAQRRAAKYRANLDENFRLVIGQRDGQRAILRSRFHATDAARAFDEKVRAVVSAAVLLFRGFRIRFQCRQQGRQFDRLLVDQRQDFALPYGIYVSGGVERNRRRSGLGLGGFDGADRPELARAHQRQSGQHCQKYFSHEVRHCVKVIRRKAFA